MKPSVIAAAPALYAAYKSFSAIETLPTHPSLTCTLITSATIGLIAGVTAQIALDAGFKGCCGERYRFRTVTRQLTWRDKILPSLGAAALFTATSFFFCQAAGDIAKSCTNGVQTTIAQAQHPAPVNKTPTLASATRKDLALN